MRFTCPICNKLIENSEICPFCNSKLINLDNELYSLEKYSQIKQVDDMINNLNIEYPKIMESFQKTERELNEEYFTSEKENMIKEIENIILQLYNIKESIERILFDEEQLTYVMSMNKIFGDMENKLNISLNQANSLIDYAKDTKIKIYQLDTSNTEDRIKNIHEFFDENLNFLDQINEDFENILKNEDSRYILQNNVNIQKEFKDKIATINELILKINTEINKLKCNPLKIEHIEIYDSKYGSIHDKITKITVEIEMMNQNIDKILYLIELNSNNIEKKINNQQNIRRLDL